MKLNWSDLQNLLENRHKYDIIRSPEVRKRLDTHMSKINNIDEYILQMVDFSEEKYKILENDYPYNVEDSIKHYVFWINPQHNIKIQEAKQICLDKWKEKDIIIFENPTHMKTVKNIKHYQVFLK
jgi:hypothetical protein